jgi:alanyl-tRNA synthetase
MTDDSIELCGGTHASRTGDLGLFKIVSESGVAAGVRATERELGKTAALLKSSPAQASEKVESLLGTVKEKNKEIEDLRRKLMSGSGGGVDLTQAAKEQAGVKVLGAVVEGGDGKALRELAEQLRDKLQPAVILLGTKSSDGRALLACTVSKEATDRFKAGDIVKDAAVVVGGGGGGRPDFAQAGGTDATKLAEAVARVYELVK